MPKHHPEEFKRDAVKLAKNSDSISRTARELGLAEATLHRWVRQADVDAGKAEGLTTDERKELAQLKRENRVLREEREILKKAAAWFAKENEKR